MSEERIFLAYLYSLRYFPKNPFDSFKEIVGGRSLDNALEFVFKGNGFSYKYTDENSRREIISRFFPDNNTSDLLIEVKTTTNIYDVVGKIFSREYHEGGLSDSLIVSFIVGEHPPNVGLFEASFLNKFEYKAGVLGIELARFKSVVVGEDYTSLHEALKEYFSKVREYYSLLNQQGISFEDFYKSMNALKKEKDDDIPQITYDGSLNA